MKKIFIVAFFALNCHLSTINCLYAKDYYPYFFDAQSLTGGSGKIFNPSTKTAGYNCFALGVHSFQLSISHGFPYQGEWGLFFDLKEVTKEQFDLKKIYLHAKYQIVHRKEGYFDLALGWKEDYFYLVSEKFFPQFYRGELLMGLSLPKENDEIKVYPFFAFSQNIKSQMFILEYNSKKDVYAFGWRFLLSPKIKLDLFLIDLQKIKDINNFVFGLTLSS